MNNCKNSGDNKCSSNNNIAEGCSRHSAAAGGLACGSGVSRRPVSFAKWEPCCWLLVEISVCEALHLISVDVWPLWGPSTKNTGGLRPAGGPTPLSLGKVTSPLSSPPIWAAQGLPKAGKGCKRQDGSLSCWRITQTPGTARATCPAVNWRWPIREFGSTVTFVSTGGGGGDSTALVIRGRGLVSRHCTPSNA